MTTKHHILLGLALLALTKLLLISHKEYQHFKHKPAPTNTVVITQEVHTYTIIRIPSTNQYGHPSR